MTFTSKGAHGASSELIASAHLLQKGYYVFRSQSPSSPFDLIAYSNGECIRVEVKSAMMRNGVPGYPHPSNDEYDLLIVVGPDNHCFEFDCKLGREEITDSIRGHYGFLPALRHPGYDPS